MTRLVRTRTLLLGLLLATLPAGGASAEEYDFFMIFGSQSQPKRLKYTHTWATFIRAVGEGSDLNTYALDQSTISWLPETLEVKVWDLFPEPGTNLDLDRSIEVVSARRESITMGASSSSRKSCGTGRSGFGASSRATPPSTRRSAPRESCSSATASTRWPPSTPSWDGAMTR